MWLDELIQPGKARGFMISIHLLAPKPVNAPLKVRIFLIQIKDSNGYSMRKKPLEMRF